VVDANGVPLRLLHGMVVHARLRAGVRWFFGHSSVRLGSTAAQGVMNAGRAYTRLEWFRAGAMRPAPAGAVVPLMEGDVASSGGGEYQP
jgi:hypothetical protein